MGAVSTSLLINLVPLTTVSLSVIWLGEPWTSRQLAGTVLVLSALLLNPLLQALSRHRAKPLLP
jgi:drug/metabolite transporter (DMT)-like permease